MLRCVQQAILCTVSLKMGRDVQMVAEPRIWEISFSGEKENNDLRKCSLATENLQFTGDICRMIRIRKLSVCVPKVKGLWKGGWKLCTPA